MPGYFQTLGIPLLSGRDFTTNDKTGAQRVCILNRSAADYFFPGRNPVSSTLRLGNDPKDPAAEVIAVVGDTHYSDLRESAPRLLYESYIGGNFWNSSATVSIRSGNTAAAVSAVRQALRQLAPDVAIDNPVTMPQLIAASVSRERLVAVLAGFFALLTLTLTAIGLYGLLSYAVVRRRTEIGIRMALGASRSAAVWVVLSDAMRMVLSGLLLGSIAAWATTRLLGSLLFNIKPLDPWACAASLALLMAAAILACVLPASRAASVDPMEALRSE
jgi:predicted permease